MKQRKKREIMENAYMCILNENLSDNRQLITQVYFDFAQQGAAFFEDGCNSTEEKDMNKMIPTYILVQDLVRNLMRT